MSFPFSSFETLKNDVIRQCRKYIQYEDHELDFTYEDIRCLSDELFDAINRCQRMQFTQLDKRLRQKLPIQIEDFNKLCFAVADSLYFDKFLRPVANELSFWSITIWLWSHSEDRKTIDKVLLETLRSFL